ncbi:MAG: tRNA preQ1(34) S-adenosylmethionine ribosyltransferase-isomerase QueA [Clostridiales bacterium]|nr:tRNA preQ1(34) S-adenosylmethionine ribosyltransferase-isomerase QueA [Clostridiales bacterium]
MDKKIFELETYNYNLPEDRIAQFPLEKRDEAKLLVYNKSDKSITHKRFYNIIDYLNQGDVLVINNTKVIPARLYGKKDKTGANIEILLLKRINYTDWEILMKPGKRAPKGTIVIFSDKLSLEVLDTLQDGNKIVRFNFNGVFENILEELGEMPLPHYIKKKLEHNEDYQTVYAKHNGSSAAPTAGLHFTDELLTRIKDKGVKVVEVLLHVGLGTFRPVNVDNILDHKMHSEYIEVTKESADIINNAKKQGNRIIAVGTTSIRTLESSADDNGVIHETKKDTDIFIYPGYKFKIVDAVITNFHLPKSTLIMLISAFCGIDETLRFYNEAVDTNYRFFSFGDACYLYGGENNE